MSDEAETLCAFSPQAAEVMAFGDGLNDLDMMQFAGISVAMENADPLIMEKASYVTASNNAAGIARALEHYGII